MKLNILSIFALATVISVSTIATACDSCPAPEKKTTRTEVKAEKSETKWLTDITAAQAQAKKEKKYILIDFSGSDWCHWCVKLEEEVFSKKEFAEYADKNLVLVLADFPRVSNQSEALKKHNQALSKKYGIRGFPTIIILDSEGKKVSQLGYQPGGPEAYIRTIKSKLTK